MAGSVQLKSAHDGSTLSLRDVTERQPRDSDGPEYFEVDVSASNISAHTRVYGYMSSGLPELFESFAQDWKGWNGERTWSSLEGEFTLSATSDSLGHVWLVYRLRNDAGGQTWELKGRLLLEAGQLEAVARDMRAFWESSAT